MSELLKSAPYLKVRAGANLDCEEPRLTNGRHLAPSVVCFLTGSSSRHIKAQREETWRREETQPTPEEQRWVTMEGGCKTAVELRKWEPGGELRVQVREVESPFFLSEKHQRQEVGQVFQSTDRFGACGGAERWWQGPGEVTSFPGGPREEPGCHHGSSLWHQLLDRVTVSHQSFGTRTGKGAGPHPPASRSLRRVFLLMVCLYLSSKTCHQRDAKSFQFSWL